MIKSPPLTLLFVTILLLFTWVMPVSAQGTLPVGGCAAGFDELHEFHQHEMDQHEQHIGLTFDLNGDGFICVKHLDNGLHVHADNVVP